MMTSIKETQKKYCSRALMAAIFIGFALILAGYKPAAKGLILGGLFSIINFILIGESLPLRMGKSRRNAFMISAASILFRFLLMAVPLVVAIKYEPFNVFAVIPGLFLIQIVILVDHFITVLLPTHSSRVKGKV
jgi:hypothetical protein